MKNGVSVPKEFLYKSKDYNKLNSAEKKYLNVIYAIKREVDQYLPQANINPRMAPQIRKN
jgi:hypothetical protein